MNKTLYQSMQKQTYYESQTHHLHLSFPTLIWQIALIYLLSNSLYQMKLTKTTTKNIIITFTFIDLITSFRLFFHLSFPLSSIFFFFCPFLFSILSTFPPLLLFFFSCIHPSVSPISPPHTKPSLTFASTEILKDTASKTNFTNTPQTSLPWGPVDNLPVWGARLSSFRNLRYSPAELTKASQWHNGCTVFLCSCQHLYCFVLPFLQVYLRCVLPCSLVFRVHLNVSDVSL